jgi:hypothetical protein
MGDSVRYTAEKEAAEYAKKKEGEHFIVIFYLFIMLFLMGVSGFIGWTWGQNRMRVLAAKNGAGEFVLVGNSSQTEFRWKRCTGIDCKNCGLVKERE